MRNTIMSGLCASVCAVTVFEAAAGTASALVREAEPLPGSGQTVTAINNSAVNGVGGFTFTVNTVDGGGNTISNIWGNALGGTGTLIRSEQTIGDLQQTAFEAFFGMADSGSLFYGTTSTRLSDGTTGLDGVFLDDTIIQNEEDAVAAAPGEFSSFNSRPGITQNGIPYWAGGLTPTVGGGSVDRALFKTTSNQIIIRGGDPIGGIAEPLTTGSGVDFDVRFSEAGSSYIMNADVASSSTDDAVVIIDGNAMMPGGSVMRENNPVPASIGGLAGELWDNFDFLGINESGSTFVTGDTQAATTEDEFVFQNGQIILREGASIVTDLGVGILSGSIEGGYQNTTGDWAVIWDVTVGGSNVEALIVNGKVHLLETQAVDWNNDGVIDGADQGAVLTDFTGITAMTLGDRLPDGTFDVLFAADVDLVDAGGAVLEGGFRMNVPAPGGVAVLGLTGLFALRRKR